MFSYFESSVDGIIPNEYTSLEEICHDLFSYIVRAKDYLIDCSAIVFRRCRKVQKQLLTPDVSKKFFPFTQVNDDLSSKKKKTQADKTTEQNDLMHNKEINHKLKKKLK